jgi:tetratricopeptide (TPR) repeat protein
MMETLAQYDALAALLVGAVIVIVLLRAAVRTIHPRRSAAVAPASPGAQPEAATRPDSAALAAAVAEAEAAGQPDRLPGLYLSLARCHLQSGQTSDAEHLLLKSIRGAANGRHKGVHAQARLALGDLAHASGDPTTACEHWQIARALFHELKQPRDHEAAETRMLRNGCPTDWVLTDF